jgi:hypothetical protein
MSTDFSSGPLQFDPNRRGGFRPGPVAIWGFFILCLVLIVFLFGTTSLQGVKNWLARSEAGAAMEAIQEERWGYAVMCLQKARSYAPEEPEVLLATIEFLKVTEGDPVTLGQQLKILADKQPLTADQQILLASSLLKAGSLDKARETFESLPEDIRQQEQSMQLAAAILAAEGRGDEARQIKQQVREKSPDSPESLLETALAQRRSTLEKERRASRDILWQLSQDQTNVGLQAITHLAMDESITWQETGKLLDLVDSHTQSSLPVRLGIITTRMRLRPDLRETLISEEVARFQQDGGGKLDEIARWLAFEKQHGWLLRLIPPHLRNSSRELFPIVAQALAEEGRWQELKTMLTSGRPPVKKARVELWLAEAESNLTPGQDANARRHLKSSIETARLEKDLLTLVAAVPAAERLSHPDLALLACDALLEHRTGQAQMEILQKAAGLATQLRDTRSLLAYTRQLHELRPTSPVFADQLAYLRLILGEEIEMVDVPSLQKLGSFEGIKLAEKRIPVELLQGLAAYRLGDQEALRRHLGASAVSTGLPPGHRAVLSGLLASTGKPAEAFQIAEKVPEALLLAEELAFLKLAR